MYLSCSVNLERGSANGIQHLHFALMKASLIAFFADDMS